MATYGRRHSILISEEIEILRDQIRRDMFDGAEGPTRIKIHALSGSIDPLTEQVTYFGQHSWANVSGIIHTIGENDSLLGFGGKVRVGDTSVLYHYDAVSGITLQNDMKEIEILVHGVSGLYHVNGYKWSSLSGQPMFLKVALSLDPR